MSPVSIRPATLHDAEALLAIYRPYVLTTAISFELEPPTLDEFRARVQRALADYAWLVAERDAAPVAYAYGTPHRARGAYKWSVETSVYAAPSNHRQGVGRTLYEALLPMLAQKGYCNAYAGITLPNDASVALHRRVGFQAVGVFRAVGRKLGAWQDVSWWHCPLRSEPPHE
jgi:L-amino acid N-acyltransferase YncA